MSQNLLEANELIVVKKILSIRRHYNFINHQGIKLGEATGNILQISPKFRVIDNLGVEIMYLQGKKILTSKELYFL